MSAIETYDESESKFLRKAKESPFVPIGLYAHYLPNVIII